MNTERIRRAAAQRDAIMAIFADGEPHFFAELQQRIDIDKVKSNLSLARTEGLVKREAEQNTLIYHITAGGLEYLKKNDHHAQQEVASNACSSGPESPPPSQPAGAAASDIPVFVPPVGEAPAPEPKPEAPDAAQVHLIEGYLAWKWGLQSSLPADHPFAHAAELKHALDTIAALKQQLEHARQPENWNAAAMLRRIRAMLECGIELCINESGFYLVDGRTDYALESEEEFIAGVDALVFLVRRKSA